METELPKTFFLEESANNFDAVATLTGVDEENIITSMFLDSVGVKKEHYQGQPNQSVGDHWRSGYDQYRYAKKRIAVDTIMHFIRGRYNAQFSNLEALHHVANGRIETLQFQIKEDNKLTQYPSLN